MRIVLNAGHMPEMDPGARGAYSKEANVCRRVMEGCGRILRDEGNEVLTVQCNELEPIAAASDDFGADIFVAIHCNGASTPAAKGTEVYAMSEEGYSLGLFVDYSITRQLETADRGVKDGSRLYLVNRTEAVAVLVELAFITNEEDERRLNERTEDFAAALAAGITRYTAEKSTPLRKIYSKRKENSMDEIMTYVSGYGFPIVVSGYLLVRIEERLKELDRTIGELARSIDRFISASTPKI